MLRHIGASVDLIIRNARLSTRPAEPPVDIGMEGGRIAVIAPALAAEGRDYDAAGALACAGLIETHIHLDKSRIIKRPAGRDA
jgi:cytosine/creatinine deaminase